MKDKSEAFEVRIPLGRVVLYQSIGFLAIIALSWFVEVTNLRAYVLGNHPYISDFKESTLEMLLVLAVWLLVASHTRRLVRRTSYLERFMRVCSWCHRVDSDGRWISQEEFIQKSFDTPTTHGICPKCLAQQLEKVKKPSVAPPRPTGRDASVLPPVWRGAVS